MCIMCVPGACGVQKRASDLELQLWMDLNAKFYYLVNIMAHLHNSGYACLFLHKY